MKYVIHERWYKPAWRDGVQVREWHYDARCYADAAWLIAHWRQIYAASDTGLSDFWMVPA